MCRFYVNYKRIFDVHICIFSIIAQSSYIVGIVVFANVQWVAAKVVVLVLGSEYPL